LLALTNLDFISEVKATGAAWNAESAEWFARSCLAAWPHSWSNSVLFLWLAFGSLNFLAGQVIGKIWMVLFATPIVAWLGNRDRRAGLSA
jgi:hypothetical protein